MSKSKMAAVVDGKMIPALRDKWCEALRSGKYTIIKGKYSDNTPSDRPLRDLMGILVELIDPSRIGAGFIGDWWHEQGLFAISPSVTAFNDGQFILLPPLERGEAAAQWIERNIPVSA